MSLLETFADYQAEHAAAISAAADEAARAFEEFRDGAQIGFASPEKPWSYPWLNALGADVSERQGPGNVALVLGEGLVRHYGAAWGAMEMDQMRIGIFQGGGSVFTPLRTLSAEVLEGRMGAHLGLHLVYVERDLGGPQLYPDLGTPGPEGYTSVGQMTRGMYRSQLFHCALRRALDEPATRLHDAAPLAALDVAQDEPDLAVELYNRALELGMEPIEDELNRTLEEHGRIPLI